MFRRNNIFLNKIFSLEKLHDALSKVPRQLKKEEALQVLIFPSQLRQVERIKNFSIFLSQQIMIFQLFAALSHSVLISLEKLMVEAWEKVSAHRGHLKKSVRAEGGEV